MFLGSSLKTVFVLRLVATATLLFSLDAGAVPIANPVVSGTPCTVYAVTAPGILTATTCTAANVTTALTGNASDPTGNVELGRFGSSPATTLSGTLSGNPITLSSLVLADWTANSNTLATAYIQGAALAAYHAALSPADLAAAINAFFTVDLQPGPGVLNPWQLVSDPNISYVNLDSGILHIGLAGLLDATPILQILFPAALFPSLPPVPPGSQASEVVKVTYGGVTNYRYGFFATPSGYHTSSFPTDQSYTGNYDTPIPGVLWLFSIGFATLFLEASRRQAT